MAWMIGGALSGVVMVRHPALARCERTGASIAPARIALPGDRMRSGSARVACRGNTGMSGPVAGSCTTGRSCRIRLARYRYRALSWACLLGTDQLAIDD